jgi:hypothetical protein
MPTMANCIVMALTLLFGALERLVRSGNVNYAMKCPGLSSRRLGVGGAVGGCRL